MSETKRQATQYTTVTMDDGREVQFAGKRKLIKTSTITPDGAVEVRLDFVNGETRLFKLPDSLLLQFAAHGAEQKLGDEIAGLDDTDDAVLAIDDLMERLTAGQWAAARESSGLAGTSVLARALIAVTGKAPEAIKQFLASKTHAEKTALRNNPKVLAEVQRIEAEKAAKGKGKNKPQVDTDALLGELDA